MSEEADLNTLSDEALRILLRRTLERNAELEGVLSAIADSVRDMRKMHIDFGPKGYAELCSEYGDEDEYLKVYSWVEDEREKMRDEGVEPGDRRWPLYPHECPFFSEMFLYDVFGKDDARTILAYFGELRRFSVEDPEALERRRKQWEDLARYADNVYHWESKRKRLAMLLDPKEREWISRRPNKTDEELQAELDEVMEKMTKAGKDLADDVRWFLKDFAGMGE